MAPPTLEFNVLQWHVSCTYLVEGCIKLLLLLPNLCHMLSAVDLSYSASRVNGRSQI